MRVRGVRSHVRLVMDIFVVSTFVDKERKKR